MPGREQLPSANGIYINGIGTVGEPLERKGWLRRNASKVRISLDGAAIAGLAATQAVIFLRSGFSAQAVYENIFLLTGQGTLIFDGFFRGTLRNKDRTEIATGLQREGIGEVSKPPAPVSLATHLARGIIDCSYVVGTALPIADTAINILSKRYPEAVLTGAVDAVLLSNLGERERVKDSIIDETGYI